MVPFSNSKPLAAVCKVWLCRRELPYICVPLCCWKTTASLWGVTPGTRIDRHCSWSSLCWLETSTWCIVSCYQWDCSKLGWYGPYLGPCFLQWAESIFILICLHLLVTSYAFSWKQNSYILRYNSQSLLALGKATPFHFSPFRLIHLSVKSYWQIHHSILWKTVNKWSRQCSRNITLLGSSSRYKQFFHYMLKAC